MASIDASDDQLALLSLADVASLIRQRAISAIDVTHAVLRRIESTAPLLNCYITVLAEAALRDARAIDLALGRGEVPGPLTGIPVSVKDNIAVSGAPTTLGSPTCLRPVASADATCVGRLRSAGAIVVATANMWELACSRHNPRVGVGAAHNPWNIERDPGGSSSGSGVAVSSGLCFGSIGTDGGGSVRVPAAWTGVVGLKPTWGRIDMQGVVTHLDTLDHLGPLTRTARDAALVLDAICPDGPLAADDLDRGLRGLRVRVLEPGPGEPVQEWVRSALEAAARTLAADGAKLVSRPLPSEIVTAGVPLRVIAQVEGADFYRDVIDDHHNQLGAEVRRFLLAGRSLSGVDYVRAQRRRGLIRLAVEDALSGVDVLVLPTTPSTATVLDRPSTSSPDPNRYTAAFNITGHPVVAVPCGFDPDGLPISIQIVGRARAEGTILRVAHGYQRVTEWHRRRPSPGAGAQRDH